MNAKLCVLASTMVAATTALTGCRNLNGTSDNTFSGVAATGAIDGSLMSQAMEQPQAEVLQRPAPQTYVHNQQGYAGDWVWGDGWFWVPAYGPPPYPGTNRTQEGWYRGNDEREFSEGVWGQRIQGNWYRGNDGWPVELPARAVGRTQGNWYLGENGWHFVGGYWGD